nr:MAG TPA: hypothetical protein [Caudoviricetes sp.]
MVFRKTLKTRMNTRKARNHNGCGHLLFMVGVGGLEPLKNGLKTV